MGAVLFRAGVNRSRPEYSSDYERPRRTTWGHCAFGFWKGALILGKEGGSGDKAMGQFGRITKPDDLPPKKVLVGYISDTSRRRCD